MVRFVMTRSQLMHSCWFVNWFDSPHFLVHAGMKITWPRDPIACWDMAKSYMEDGYDRFGNNQITTYVCTNFLLNERFIILVRLYKLARILDLFGLMDASFAVLVEMEHLIAPANVLTLARYIFGGEQYCENIIVLRKWCLRCVSKHYDWLLNSQQWEKVVEDSVPELEEKWIRIKTLKKMVSQEDLKKAIQQNVSDASAIINALSAVEIKPGTPKHIYSRIEGEFSRRPLTPKSECTFTKLERREPGTPTERQLKSNDNADLMQHSSASPAISMKSERALTGDGKLNPIKSAKPSLQGISETEEGDTNKFHNSIKRKESMTMLRTSSFQSVLGRDTMRGTVLTNNREAQLQTSTRPVNGALPYSSSEPLLTAHHNGYIYENANGSTTDKRADSDSPFLSGRGKSPTTTDPPENVHSSQPRGIILTPETLRQLDGWPLSDIPLPDPLLPVPVARRSSSLDHIGDKHKQNDAAMHRAQLVTVFGLHRPGMGGSVVVPASEEVTLAESRAGPANEAKAREFLGINEPYPVPMVGVRARSSMEVEPRKLKKRGLWAG